MAKCERERFTPRGLPRRCWQCKACLRLANDIIAGQCLAESIDCVGSHVVTLTYAEDEGSVKRYADGSERVVAPRGDHAARMLNYKDVDLLFKRLRKQGYPFKFVVSGEYGAEKGRAHWHVVFLWLEKIPPLPEMRERRRWQWRGKDGNVREFWDRGIVYFDRMDFRSLRYSLKYAGKDVAQNATWFSYSKFPPLGVRYFKRLALDYVRQRIVPTDWTYSFPDVLGADGKPHEFYLRGKCREVFLSAFLSGWREAYGAEPIPPSEFFDEWVERTEVRDLSTELLAKALVRERATEGGGYISRFQSEKGETEWLDVPRKGRRRETIRTPEATLPRLSGETYAQWRMRENERSRIRERVSFSKVRRKSEEV